MTTRVRRLSIGLLIAALAAAAAVAVAHLDLALRVENTSYDWRVRQTAPPAPPDSPIVIVEINESSVRAMEPLVGRWPWPRIVHGSAIDYMAAAGARVIAYDILFLEREGRSETVIDGRTVSGGQSDDALRTSIERAGNVLLLADATFEGLVSEAASVPSSALLPGTIYTPGEGFEARRVTLPFATIAGVASGVGHNLIRKDDGSDFARRMLPFIDNDGVAVPSIGLAAALAYTKATRADVVRKGRPLRVGSVELPLSGPRVVSRDGTRRPSTASLLRFRRPTDHRDGSRSVFETYSFFDVLLSADQLANGQTPAIPPSAFKDKRVFVGTS